MTDTLSRLEALYAAATKRPWGTRQARLAPSDQMGDVAITAGDPIPGVALGLLGEIWAERIKGQPDPQQARWDADAITALHNSAPVLFAVVRAAQEWRSLNSLRNHDDTTAHDHHRCIAEGDATLRHALDALEARDD